MAITDHLEEPRPIDELRNTLPEDMTEEEHELWLAFLLSAFDEAPEEVRTFYASRREQGLGVGRGDDGSLVFQRGSRRSGR